MDKVNKLFDAQKYDEALERCIELVEKDDKNIEALLCSGKIYHKKADFKNAMNSFIKVLSIEPENVIAKSSLEMIKGIMAFYNKDLYNP